MARFQFFHWKHLYAAESICTALDSPEYENNKLRDATSYAVEETTE